MKPPALLLAAVAIFCALAPGEIGAVRCDSNTPCEHIAPYETCCQKNGHCGWDCNGLPTILQGGEPGRPAASAPAPAPVPQLQQVFTSNGKYRSDAKCGPLNLLEDGVTPAECDPNSEYFCCSEHGFCGSSQEHCYCDTCINYRPIKVANGVRSDRRCGKDFPLEDGTPSGCDGNSVNPCCSVHGYCGPGPSHCECVGCTDYTSGKPVENPLFIGVTRADRRCGKQFKLPDGRPAECDPASDKPCCSKWGYCGPGAEHCDCPTCKDYRSAEQKLAEDWTGRFRSDRRCGKDFPLPGTNPPEPTECDPDSEDKFCCSEWGYCGGDADHCSCEKCVNFRNK